MKKLWNSIMKSTSKPEHGKNLSDLNRSLLSDMDIGPEPDIKLFRVSNADYHWSRAGQLQAEMDTTPSETLKIDESK